MASTMAVRQQGDAELIAGSRKGDSEAYAELYRRHVDAARAAARALTRSRSDADDVTSEAFTRVLRALQAGGGPEVSFRPYLITAVRNVFYDRVRRQREEPSEDMSDEVNVALLDAANSQEDGAFAAAAFATLPERWQLVLWHTEVEGKSASEVAPLLGLAPNAVAALAYRAREGLRQAYLQAHLREQQKADCRECSANLGAYVRDGLSARDRRKVDTHLDGCPVCRGLVGELAATNTTLRAALLPALLGVPAAAYLSGLGGGGLFGWFGRLPKKQQTASAGAAAAVVLALVAASVSGAFGGDDGTAAPLATDPAITAPGGTGNGDGNGNGNGDGATPSTPPTTPALTTTTSSTSTTAPTTVPITPPVTVRPTVPRPTVPRTTVPRTTVAPTTLPATTTVLPTTTTLPVPPQLSAVTTQLSPALAGGEVRIQVVLSNTGSVPANGIVLNVPVPVGASFNRTEGVAPAAAPPLRAQAVLSAGWTCTGNVSCAYASLPVGQQATVVLVFSVAPSAPASVTLTPGVSAPAGATLTGSPLTVFIDQVDGLLVAETARGSVQAIGNSVITCDTHPNCPDAQNFAAANNNHGSYSMAYVNTAGGTFNSSSATLALSGTVAHAFLVWSGDVVEGSATAPNAAAKNTLTFVTPSATQAVTAAAVFDAGNGIYTAYADVTSLVATGGTYSVADLQTAAGNGTFGGWTLVVVEHQPSLPERFLLAVAPLSPVSTSGSFTFSFDMPAALSAASADVLAVGFEGDPDLIGDSLNVGGHVVANPFQSVVGGTRAPSTPNTFGLDIVSFTATGLNGTTVPVTASTTNDRVQLAFLALSLPA